MSPKLQAVRKRLPDAIKDLNRGNARYFLEASQPLVPVDTGSLKRSGRVEKGKGTAYLLIYGGSPFTNSRTGRIINYATIVHIIHKSKSQFVGQPLRTDRLKRKVETARSFRKWLKGF